MSPEVEQRRTQRPGPHERNPQARRGGEGNVQPRRTPQRRPEGRAPQQRRAERGEPPRRRRAEEAGGGAGAGKRGLTEPIRSTVDPMVVERRRQVATQGQRRRRRLFIAVASAGTVAGLVAAALMSPMFDVDHIRVSGGSVVPRGEIERISGLTRGTPLATANVGRATEMLRADPRISFARVDRHLPGTLRIVVTEEKPVLVLRTPDGSAIVSATGRIISFSEQGPGAGGGSERDERNLTVVNYDGPIARDSSRGRALPGTIVSGPVSEVLRVVEGMPKSVSGQLESIESDGSHGIRLRMKDSAEVVFGPVEDVSAKLTALAAVYEQVDLECIATVDVRNPTRVTVKRSSGCATGR